jgi:hypothetical protein
MNIKKLFNITGKALVVAWYLFVGVIALVIKVFNFVIKLNDGRSVDFGFDNSFAEYSDEVNKQSTYQNGVSGNMRSGNIVYK